MKRRLLLISITLLLLASGSRISVGQTLYNMDFESVADFSLSFSPWIVNDADGHPTYGITGVVFPHQNSAFSYIAFNPAQTVPAMTDAAIQPHSGSRFGACFADTISPNNDWFISPRIHLDTNGSFTFWVKSYSSYYGLEKYRVGVSVTDSAPSSFTIISGATPLQADTVWTKKTFSLAAYNNQHVYVAIQCVSTAAFIFMIDDLTITASSNVAPTADFTASQTTVPLGRTVSFTDLSAGFPTSWKWTFAGGNPSASTLQNPSGIAYDTAGTYSVKLVVTNAYGSDSLVKTGYIHVYSGLPSSVLLNFESQSDFSMDFSPWLAVDADGGPTYTITGISFPNNGEPFAYMAFNPATTTPPITDQAMMPHSGNRFGACFSSVPPFNPNNKWLISPHMTLTAGAKIGFWCKTYNTDYGFEKFNVAVSTTTNNPNAFTTITGPVPLEAPVTWGYREYDLDSYAGQNVYVGIQCVSDNAFIFMVDDIQIAPNLGVNDHPGDVAFTLYPNPATDRVSVDFGDREGGIRTVTLINSLGETVAEKTYSASVRGAVGLDLTGFPRGIYLISVKDNTGTGIRKLMVGGN
jgi:PKD repeat protein